jgi:hypothetical protein
VLSSTNIHIFVSGELIFKSLIMTKNKIGPSFVLWVTPAVTPADTPTQVDQFVNKNVIADSIEGFREVQKADANVFIL